MNVANLLAERDEAREECERLRTAWTAIDRANVQLRERVEAAERERDEAKRILSLAVGRDEETLAFIISNRDDTIRQLQERLAVVEAALAASAQRELTARCELERLGVEPFTTGTTEAAKAGGV